MYAKIPQKKIWICRMRAVGYVNKVKDSFEPDSNQRPKDVNYFSTVLRSTNWAIEGTLKKWIVQEEELILWKSHKLKENLLNSMIVFILKDDKQTSFIRYQKRKKKKRK